MNERIRELAQHAGIGVWGDAIFMLDPKDTLDSNVLENFAELIVKACVLALDEADGSVHHSECLLEHFGVEE